MKNHVQLKPVTRDDLMFLYGIRNNMDDLYLWSIRRHPVNSFEEFVAEFEQDLRTDKHVFFMIKYQEHNIGFVFSYSPQFVDSYCFATIYIVPTMRNLGFGPVAMGGFLLYLFNYFNFNKIYFEVYAYNNLSLSTLKTFGALEEGRFKDHRYWNGSRHDMIRLAIYCDKRKKVQEALNRIEKRKQQLRQG